MKPTLGQVFAFSLLGLVGVLAFVFELVSSGSRETIIESSERIRAQAGRVIAERVTNFLDEAPRIARQFQRELELGLVDAHDPRAVESSLFAQLLANGNLGEVTLTYGDEVGFDDSGETVLAAKPRGQWSVMRVMGPDKEERFWSRHVYQEGSVFVADRRDLRAPAKSAAAAWIRETGGALSDPTLHATFQQPARKGNRGFLSWTDLHWSQLDADLPKEQRRVEVSVQRSVVDTGGKFAGVLRVGLLTEQLDESVRVPFTREGENDPHVRFICDEEGRLITRLAPTDQIEELDDALRIAPGKVPPEIAGALSHPLRQLAVSRRGTSVSGEFREGGKEYFVTFRELPEAQTQDWIVGVVVPRAFYLGKLSAMRQHLLAALLGVMGLLVVAGGLILRGVRSAQAQISHESLKMNAFDFAPVTPKSAFRDVTAVLESLEKAKTAMRAMSKYVPVDLVRRLYREKSEPSLGGELLEISLMFTDIKDFTTLSETLAPNELADALGQYFDVMATIIQQEFRGTINKYIGDAIMTFWNAPEPVANHALMACLAALRCRDAGRALAQSPDWRGWPAFETRFGLHCAPALIGHFGARDRMNYTAIGDAVNLASRLEGLNKQYGTTIIASEAIIKWVADECEVRLLDLVAVKGKSEAIKIYELLGKKGEAAAMHETVAAYEKAFAAYSMRDFSAAIAILEGQQSDAPSVHLLARCRAFQHEPPPEDWGGVYVSVMK